MAATLPLGHDAVGAPRAGLLPAQARRASGWWAVGLAVVLFGAAQAALEVQRAATWAALGMPGVVGGWPAATATSVARFAAVAVLGVVVARSRPWLWWVPAVVLAFGPVILSGAPFSPLGAGWATYNGLGWNTSRFAAAGLDWVMAALPGLAAAAGVTVRRRVRLDGAAVGAAGLAVFTVVVAVYSLGLVSAVPHPPWLYLPSAMVALGVASLTVGSLDRLAVGVVAAVLAVPELVSHLGLFAVTGSPHWGLYGIDGLTEPLAVMAVAVGVGWAAPRMAVLLRKEGGPLGWPVALNLANVADAALTAWFVSRGLAAEANPLVSLVGLPGKVVGVAAASLMVGRVRPGVLRWPTLVLLGVLVWHAGGLLAAS